MFYPNMKVIYVLSHCYRGDDYNKNISKHNTIMHQYARRLRNYTDRYQVEYWWTEKRISSPISAHEDGITFRAFPALAYKYPYRYISFSLLRALRLEARKGPVLFFLIGVKGKWTVLIPLFIRNVPIVMQQLTEGTRYSKARLKKRPWLVPLSILETMAYRNVDHFFLMFNRAKEEMKKYVDPGKLSIVSWGKDFELFKPMDRTEARKTLGLDLNKHYILFVGRINERKGVHYLIEALPAVLDEYPSTELLLVGPALREQTLADLKKLTEVRGLAGRVRFLGSIPNERLPLFYSAADVFVLPSTTEGFPFVLLEAAGCNCPIIATDVGGIPDFMQTVKKGIMTPPRSPADITQAIKSVFKQPDLYNNGLREAVTQYSWDSVLSREVEVFENLKKVYFPDDGPKKSTRGVPEKN